MPCQDCRFDVRGLVLQAAKCGAQKLQGLWCGRQTLKLSCPREAWIATRREQQTLSSTHAACSYCSMKYELRGKTLVKVSAWPLCSMLKNCIRGQKTRRNIRILQVQVSLTVRVGGQRNKIRILMVLCFFWPYIAVQL